MEIWKSHHYNGNSMAECDEHVNNNYKSLIGECKKWKNVYISEGILL